MGANAIISYDGTPNDDDALVLGKMLAQAGFGWRSPMCAIPVSLTRAAKRWPSMTPTNGWSEARRRWEMPKSPATSSSVPRPELAWGSSPRARERRWSCSVRTTGRHPVTWSPARPLSTSSTVARSRSRSRPPVCVRSSTARSPRSPCLSPARGTMSPARPRRALAAKLGATVHESRAEPVDLIVVGSQPDAPAGHVVIGGDVRNELDSARSSVLVLAAGVPLLP